MHKLARTLTRRRAQSSPVEPWAEEFVVPPDSVLSIIIFYAELGLLETAISPNYFTMGLWAGCRAEVSLDGKDQTPRSLSIPAFG